MPITIVFEVNDSGARAGFERLQRELNEIESELRDTQQSADKTGTAVARLGTTSQRTGQQIRQVRVGFADAGHGAASFTKALGGARGLLTDFGAAAVDGHIKTLQNLTAALRTEQAARQESRKEYFDYARQIQAAAREIDSLRALPGVSGTEVSPDNRNLIGQRTTALRQANADIARYTQLLKAAREVAVGETNPAIQQLEGRLVASQTRAAALSRELELLKNGFQDIAATETAAAVTHQSLALAKLRAAAEETRETLKTALTGEQVTPNFRAAIAASNAYYQARITQAQEALEKEKAGTEAFTALQTRIFELGRQQKQAEQQLETQRQRALERFTTERVDTERAARFSVIANIEAITHAARASFRQRLAFAQQIAAIPDVNSPEAAYGNRFGAQQRRNFAETARRGRSVVDVMREIVQLHVAPLDLDNRIPDPGVRDAEIDRQVAAAAQGARTLLEIRQAAGAHAREALDQRLQQEARAVQKSLREQARAYRQFSNLVANTFVNLATGRAERFQQVATAFIQQSIRIIARAYVEYEIQKRLDSQLTAAKLANIQKVAAAQGVGGAGRTGNLGGIGNLLGNMPGLGNVWGALSGGAAALGVSALLFPQESNNLLQGIKDEIGGFISGVSSVPDRVSFGAKQQVFLKIGENEVRDITDIQSELRDEDRV